MVRGKGINDMPKGWIKENEWNKKVYQLWTNKLMCCYDENFQKLHPTYVGCTVCERWLTLSNFVEDVPLITGYDRERFLNGELELDKDKKNDTNDKSYIMKYCTWLPKPENHGLAMKGKHHTEETKQKISEANKGKYHSEETKQKIRDNSAFKDKFGSEHPRSKKIAQYDKTTNELIKIWDSMHDVERELGLDCSNISNCCKGNRKSAGGFIWRYVEDE